MQGPLSLGQPFEIKAETGEALILQGQLACCTQGKQQETLPQTGQKAEGQHPEAVLRPLHHIITHICPHP